MERPFWSSRFTLAFVMVDEFKLFCVILRCGAKGWDTSVGIRAL